MKESWKAINEFLNKKSKSSNIDCIKQSCLITIQNNFFSSVGKDLVDKVNLTSNPLLFGDFEINKRKKTFHFITIEIHEIRDAFAKVKAAKSFGTYYISSYFFKLVSCPIPFSKRRTNTKKLASYHTLSTIINFQLYDHIVFQSMLLYVVSHIKDKRYFV